MSTEILPESQVSSGDWMSVLRWASRDGVKYTISLGRFGDGRTDITLTKVEVKELIKILVDGLLV